MYEDIDQGTQNQAENARKEVRWCIPVPVAISCTLPDGKAFEEEGTTEDVNPSGMSIFLPAPLKKGSHVQVVIRTDGFEAPAVVIDARSMGLNMHRIRVRFEGSKKYDRASSVRKYIYDPSSSSWAGYFEGGTYYNHKHEAHGKQEGNKVVSLDGGTDLFVKRGDSYYDLRGNFLGRLI